MKSFSNRERTNIAQRLEKLEFEKDQAAKIKHIKWELNPDMNSADQEELFQRKDFKNKSNMNNNIKNHSLFSEQLKKCPTLPQNPFMYFAKFDGSAQFEQPVKKYRICMCVLPKNLRMYPIQVSVVSNASVQELIGLICYKYTIEHPDDKYIP